MLYLILLLLIAASIGAVVVLPLPIIAAVPILLAGSAFILGREPVRGKARASPAGNATASHRDEGVRQALDNVPAGVILHRNGRILFASRRMRLLLGRESDSMEGAVLDEIVPPDELAALGGLGADSELPRALSFLKSDGTPVSVEASGGQVQLSDGAAAMICVRDVSARREESARRGEMAEHTRRLEEQLEHSARLAELGEMAASISHELNQPLTGIRNYARNAYYMLDQKAGAEADVKNNLRLISEQVDRAAKIINQMRELSRRADSVFVLLDPNSVIRETVEFLLPQMKLSEVAISLDLDAGLPPVWGDRTRLAQVFLNLLSNARQAMIDSPTRRLAIRSRRDPSAALPVVVEVSDSGKGFTEEQGRRLFQPFYTTRKGGHGLGLSISRSIVQDHKGTIEARGAPGEGATFCIRFPAAPREGAARSDA